MIGRVIASRYRLEKKIGSGAMGSVYRARHVKVGRAFAIKILHVDLLEDTKLQRRFVREAELAGTLSHSNIVKVTDVGETFEGLHYIAMEYAEGPTLGEIISGQSPIPAPRVVDLAAQLLDGLQHAHKHGLIHRDFKPDNVIVVTELDGKESPRIVDFGIAIVRDDATNADRERLTTAGITLGTPHYMAPEHVTGQAIDHRIDLFALGVVLFEMLCGQMPFEGDGVDVARANLLEETPHMCERAPLVDVDPLLEAFTRMLLSKSPDARPATAKAARDLLLLIAHDRAQAAGLLGVTIDDAPLPARAAKGSTMPPSRTISAASLPLVRPPGMPPPGMPPSPTPPTPTPPTPTPPTPTSTAPTPAAPSRSSPPPQYGRYTPPTPFLAVPEPIAYSPSGQHAYIGAPPSTATADSPPRPTGPLEISDPTGPYVVTTFPDASGPTRSRPQTPSPSSPRATSPSGAYRTRSARVSQAPLSRDPAQPGVPGVPGVPRAISQADSQAVPRDASQPVPRAASHPGVPRAISHADSQSVHHAIAHVDGQPYPSQPYGSQQGGHPFDSQQSSPGARPGGAPRRASTESVKQVAARKRRLYIMLGAAIAALTLGAVLAILLS